MPSNQSKDAQSTPDIPQLDSQQIMTLLRHHLPGVLGNKFPDPGALKEDAAHTLSNLSQAAFPAHLPLQQNPFQQVHHPITDPGPSSHPRGPPNLGQLATVPAVSPAVAGIAAGSAQLPASRLQGQDLDDPMSDPDDATMNHGATTLDDSASPGGDVPSVPTQGATATPGARTRTRNQHMGNDEWTRQRKDNHKEVERRRRGNINEGINELGRIVPNGSGEKAKGAILSRAVQYIHHLKENEARNIEKWTLEKLLMDQAMGDLQGQLDEVRRLWEEERLARQRAEGELEVLRSLHAGRSAVAGPANDASGGTKRRVGGDTSQTDGGADDKADGDGRSAKRPRVEERREA